jgi:predicted transcriptional regulator
MTARKITSEDFAKSKVLSARAKKSREVARALDKRAEGLPYARTFTSVEFQAFIAELTPKRFELLRLAIRRRQSIGELALASHRDPGAVSRDVARLQSLGLVEVETVINPGHGQMKIVAPVATRIAIEASLDAAAG